MKITNATSGTNVAEIADGIHRIATPVPANPSLPAGFSFNQYLIVDDAPLLFHTGPRGMFPLVREAIDSVIPASTLRYVAFSHFEADECGGLNEFLALAPAAVPVCSQVANKAFPDWKAGGADAYCQCALERMGKDPAGWSRAYHIAWMRSGAFAISGPPDRAGARASRPRARSRSPCSRQTGCPGRTC